VKYLICLLFLFNSLSISAQLEITNLDLVLVDQEPSPQTFTLNVMNVSMDSIDFDWEIVYKNDTDAFLAISVSDINIDYTPATLTSCGIVGVSNILAAEASYPMGLHVNFDEIPVGFDLGSTLAHFNLYSNGACFTDTLLSLPVLFETSTSTLESQDTHLGIFPNPTSDYLYILHSGDLNLAHYRIYDLQYRKVLEGQVENKQIDVASITEGVYLLYLNGDAQLFVKK